MTEAEGFEHPCGALAWGRASVEWACDEHAPSKVCSAELQNSEGKGNSDHPKAGISHDYRAYEWSQVAPSLSI